VLELLVVASIVLLLAGLLLPALERARDSARRVQCRNNLRQIGLALHAYQSTSCCYPPGWVLEQPVRASSRNGWGWLAMLLSTAGEQPTYNQINFSCHLADEANRTARLTVIEWFLCPAERATRHVVFYRRGQSAGLESLREQAESVPPGRPMLVVAAASYAGVFGTFDPDDCHRAADGTFGQNRGRRPEEFVDGLACTAVVGERSARRLPTTWTGMHQDEVEGPERVVGFMQDGPNRPGADEAEFSSRHHGGVHLLFADGSVRFISDRIDVEVYRALATVAGGELAGTGRH